MVIALCQIEIRGVRFFIHDLDYDTPTALAVHYANTAH